MVIRNAGGTPEWCRLVDVTGPVLAAGRVAEGKVLRISESGAGSGTMLLVTESEERVHTSRLIVGKAAGN